jgi:hypothetical protein
VLPLLLLASVVFSATFGVVHTHGAPPSGPAARASKAAGFVKSGDLDGARTGGPLRPGDCSICQLQRQLSGGLLYGPVFTPAPPAEHAVAAPTADTYLSSASAPRRGRAPPQTSL